MIGIKRIIEKRPGKWPSYYDDHDVKDYCEYFIKGTNIKLGFTCFSNETNEEEFYCIVCDGYDQMDPYDTEKELFDHFEWMLMNKNLTWRYYE
jgi:hypothetical protein